MHAPPSPLDRLIPQPDVRERFETTVEAPAAVVLAAAAGLDLQSLPLVRAIFRLRELLMGASPAARARQGLLADMQSLGWGVLHEEADRCVVCGATCRPWLADVTFTPIPPAQFASFAQPGQVKIAWTLEAVPLGPTTTRFAQETRAVATDAQARLRFRRYWRWARFGIVAIRLLLLPAVRRDAQRRWAGGAARG